MNKAKLRIIQVIEQPDGSALVDIEYDKNFTKVLREHYNRKRCTKKLIERAIKEGIENYDKLYGDKMSKHNPKPKKKKPKKNKKKDY